jgi:chorismate synthase
VARAFLGELGVRLHSVVTRIGNVAIEVDPDTLDVAVVEKSDVRCPDQVAAERMREEIDAARTDGESLGGTFVVWATGLVPGVGGYATARDRLDARLAGAVASIPAIKGVEFGDGFELAARRGSEAHDEILPGEDHPQRRTNRAGGLEGGMTNGQTLVVRAAMKPIPTLMRPLASVDLSTSEPVDASKERSDVCAVPAASVVAEAEVAMVLADAYTTKFGQDALGDVLTALQAYRDRIGW